MTLFLEGQVPLSEGVPSVESLRSYWHSYIFMPSPQGLAGWRLVLQDVSHQKKPVKTCFWSFYKGYLCEMWKGCPRIQWRCLGSVCSRRCEENVYTKLQSLNADSPKEDIPGHPGRAHLRLSFRLWMVRKFGSPLALRQSVPGAWLGKFQTLFLQTAHITDGQSGPGETDCEAGFLLTNMPLDSGSLRECAGDFSGSCPSKNF